MSDKDEVERLKTAIARAIGELEHQLNTPVERREGDGNNSLRYALGALWECVSPEKDEDRKAHDCNPATMTNKELVDEFASLYTIHSNPTIYRNLKAGYDEILRRLEGKDALIKALQPFARLADRLDAKPMPKIADSFYEIHGGDDNEGVGASISFTQCRAARSAINKAKGEKGQ